MWVQMLGVGADSGRRLWKFCSAGFNFLSEGESISSEGGRPAIGKRSPCENTEERFEDAGLEDWREMAPSHVMPAAPEAGRSKEWVLPQSLQRKSSPAYTLTQSTENCERINFSVKPLSLW